MPRPQAQPPANLDFVSALDAAAAIRQKTISSVELTRRTFERLDRYNPLVNAFTYQMREEALLQAQECDHLLARGEATGVFHGVPVHVKESFGVAGRPCTWGIPALQDKLAARDSDAVTNLRKAGAVLMGATNVPLALGDLQTYNSLYGTTNNPWDPARTPGGSSGGSAAALAAGLGYLSVGSDLGGSIRIPAHFTGIYGHKPTLDLVSMRGQLPGGEFKGPGFSSLLAVAGPMARSAGDLLAALRVLGGPVGWDAKAWRWEIPEPRARTLRDFRVGYVLDDPISPVFDEVKPAMERTLRTLERAGAKLVPGWPSGYNPSELLKTNRFIASAFIYSVGSKQEQEQEKLRMSPALPPGEASFAEWQRYNLRRVGFRAQWQAWFENVDVFLTPVAFAAAFPHDHSAGPRTIGGRSYWNILSWIAAPSLTGCPATVAPAGRTESGLPIGIQIMGPFWEDATPITFAELLAQEIGGFTPPARLCVTQPAGCPFSVGRTIVFCFLWSARLRKQPGFSRLSGCAHAHWHKGGSPGFLVDTRPSSFASRARCNAFSISIAVASCWSLGKGMTLSRGSCGPLSQRNARQASGRAACCSSHSL